MSLSRLDLPREVRAQEAARLAATGLNATQVARAMGVSRSYASELLDDPLGEKVRARKRRNGKPCLDCGTVTDGSNGRANAPDYCLACYDKRRAAQHGTRSKYAAGCSCDACREANRAAHRERMQRPGPPPTHSASGYQNYGCRCEVCTKAHTDALWRGGYQERWEAKVRGTEPPRHGTVTSYGSYGCRCEVCRDGYREYRRRYRERKRQEAAA